MVRRTDDFFDLYFRYREKTEPPIIFHRWALVGCIGAWLGRQMWLPFGSSRIFPNHYIMFVGHPGARKTTAINQAFSLLSTLGYTTVAADKTSKEKWLIDLSGEEYNVQEMNKKKRGEDILDDIHVLDIGNQVPREVFIVADEFNDFLGNGNTEFQSLLGRFWDWDRPEASYTHKLKNSKPVSIYQPTVSILSGNTPQNFALCFPQESIGQGFMSRLILVHGEASGKRYSMPVEPEGKLKEELLATLLAMKTKCVGPVTIEPDAMNALDMIYRTWPELDDMRFKHYSTRRYTHLLKLCMIFCATRCSTEIILQDVLKANTILVHAETLMPKAMGEVGNSRSSIAANKVMQVLYEAKEPKTVVELYKIVRTDLEQLKDLHPILMSLMAAEKIQQATTIDGKSGYLPRQSIISRKILYVDWEYLKGREVPT